MMSILKRVKEFSEKKLLLIAVFPLLFLNGCTECNDETCFYEPGTVALWSDDNTKLAAAFIDYGDSTSPNDNTSAIFTLNVDGSDFSHIYDLESGESLSYYSENYNYILLTTDHLAGLGVREYKKINLDNLNVETLSINDQACFDRKILPSIDGSTLAIVEVTGQENGGGVDSSDIDAIFTLRRDNSENNSGCHELSVKISFVDINSNEVIQAFKNDNVDVTFFVLPGNIMTVNIDMFWSNQGVIINTTSTSDRGYSLLTLDGASSAYEFPDSCYAVTTGSSYISHENIEAKVFAIIDDGLYSVDNKVELTDLSTADDAEYSAYEYPSLGKDICTL